MNQQMDAMIGNQDVEMGDASAEDSGDYATGIYNLLRQEFLSSSTSSSSAGSSAAAGSGSTAGGKPLFVSELLKKATNRGYSPEQFQEVLDQYVGLGVFKWTDQRKDALQYVSKG